MKIIFIGSVKFSGIILKYLIQKKATIVAVCTKETSSFNSDHEDLSTIARENDIPFKYTIDINSKQNVSWIKSFNADIIFCFGWSQLIKTELINLPPYGIIGYHPAKIPQNRGRHPIIWALTLGLTETASTFFKLDVGADTGPILFQDKVPISKNDTASSLYKKIIKIALKQIDELLKTIKNKKFKFVKQQNNNGNFWRKRNKSDGFIDWRISARNIYNLVRALQKPYPGAHFIYMNQEIKLWNCKVVKNNSKNIEPGKILSVDKNGILIKCGDDSLLLTDTEPKVNITKNHYLY